MKQSLITKSKHMKKLSLALLISLFTSLIFAQVYRPYVSGLYTKGTVEEVVQTVKEKLLNNDILILGEYTPANDPNRKIISFTSQMKHH